MEVVVFYDAVGGKLATLVLLVLAVWMALAVLTAVLVCKVIVRADADAPVWCGDDGEADR